MPLPIAPPEVASARRLGERACVVDAGGQFTVARQVDDLAAHAAVGGAREFVFDLGGVRRYETQALAELSDLCRRLSSYGCEVIVSAHDPGESRASYQQDLWHYTIGRMVDACAAAGIFPFYGPFGDIRDLAGCEAQFRAAFLMGCVGAWSLHPAQIDVAKKVFSPDPDEVIFARKVIEAIPDGRGVHMIDGKMQDDATWKQCRVMVDLAEMLAVKDPDLAEVYGIGSRVPA